MLICNFTGSYIKFLDSITGSDQMTVSRMTAAGLSEDLEILDLTDIRESSGYCSDEAADLIRRRIKGRNVRGVRYLDDGNHHYLSKLWMEKIEEPFDLVVFDHHTDMQMQGLVPYLSCGSWVRDSIYDLIMLNDIYLIGVPDDTELPEDLPDERIHIIGETEAHSCKHVIEKSSFPIYVSVDLDVLSPDEYKSVWDQGSLTKKLLMDWLKYLKTCRRAIAVDFCG